MRTFQDNELKRMMLYKHIRARDVAIRIVNSKGFWFWKRHYVEFYNVNYHKISGNLPLYIGADWIRIKDIKDYKIVEYKQEIKKEI